MTVAPREHRERCPATGGPAPAEEPALGRRPRGDWSGAEPDRRRSRRSRPRRCAGHACPDRTGSAKPRGARSCRWCPISLPTVGGGASGGRRTDPVHLGHGSGRTGRGSPCRRAGQISLGPPLGHPHAAPSTLPRRRWPALRRRQLRHRPTQAGSTPTGRTAETTDLNRRAAPMRDGISFDAVVLRISSTFNIIASIAPAATLRSTPITSR